jgi:hypothetical protein
MEAGHWMSKLMPMHVHEGVSSTTSKQGLVHANMHVHVPLALLQVRKALLHVSIHLVRRQLSR